ncbi:hypothetical protein D3C76_1699520 [compost metagenome]
MDRVAEVFDPKYSHHQTQILRVPLGDHRKLMVISETSFLGKRFLSCEKLQALLTSEQLGLRFENAERGKV